MHELIIARIRELLSRENCSPHTMRWRNFWYDKNLEPIHIVPKNKDGLIHVSNIEWGTVPADKLVILFERIVAQSYRQFG